MQEQKKKNIHIISIGGSIMHDLAINLKKSGNNISGSDDIIYNPSKSRLEKNDILPKKLGYYNTNLDICSDYDFFFKLFNKKNIYGSHTKKKEVIGFFRPGGLSEKISLIKRLYYEFKIRYQNKQNIYILVFLLS